MNENEISPRYNRVKGAPWFATLNGMEVMVLGQGGIGSWVSLALARVGCHLHTFDHDTFEIHNMSGQMVRAWDIGKLKTKVISDILEDFAPDCKVTPWGKYEVDSPPHEVMICGFDNMLARKIAFANWVKLLASKSMAERRLCFFQDGRLNVEQLQILSIPGDDNERIDRYQAEYLALSDEEIPDQECTFTQTTPAAWMIAGHMVAFFTNWATNCVRKNNIRTVPFFYRYFIPVNMTEIK